MTAGSHGGGRIVRPPRPYRYSDAGSRLAVRAPCRPRAFLGRRAPHPEKQTVLMDEGWVESNRGGEGGDKICPHCCDALLSGRPSRASFV